MSKWTPGKWSVHQIRNKYQVRGNEDGPFRESKFNILLLNEADARLIAEAPAMAELLLSIVNNGKVSNEELADAQAILERINR